MDCFAPLAMTASPIPLFKLGTIRNTSLLRMSSDCEIDRCFNVNRPPATPPRMSSHHATKSSVAAISIFASAGMAAAKFVVGIAIGSLALISEALHSSVDLVATVITWMVVRVSDKPADDEHHYGHGKIESLSALGVIAMLYVLAGGILVAAYARLHEGTPPPALSPVSPAAVSRNQWSRSRNAVSTPSLRARRADGQSPGIDRRVQRLRDQRERADRNADREFRRRHAGAGKNRDRGDGRFDGMTGAHGRRCSRAVCNIKADTEDAIATHSQKRFVANCYEFKWRSRVGYKGRHCEQSSIPHPEEREARLEG